MPQSISKVQFGTPYKKEFSENNIEIVKKAVAERFPEWSDQCQPGVNVLTVKAWNARGYRIKKGEKGIRLNGSAPVKEKDDKGEENVVGSRFVRAYVFALPQVEKK